MRVGTFEYLEKVRVTAWICTDTACRGHQSCSSIWLDKLWRPRCSRAKITRNGTSGAENQDRPRIRLIYDTVLDVPATSGKDERLVNH